MTIEEKIKEIKTHLLDTTDISVLSEWDLSLSTEYAFIAQELAQVKRDRAGIELELKENLLAKEGKYTEKEIERLYFSSEQGQYYVYASEILKGIAKLISAIRFQREMLKR